jgi:hypothetical protein
MGYNDPFLHARLLRARLEGFVSLALELGVLGISDCLGGVDEGLDGVVTENEAETVVVPSIEVRSLGKVRVAS